MIERMVNMKLKKCQFLLGKVQQEENYGKESSLQWWHTCQFLLGKVQRDAM